MWKNSLSTILFKEKGKWMSNIYFSWYYCFEEEEGRFYAAKMMLFRVECRLADVLSGLK